MGDHHPPCPVMKLGIRHRSKKRNGCLCNIVRRDAVFDHVVICTVGDSVTWCKRECWNWKGSQSCGDVIQSEGRDTSNAERREAESETQSNQVNTTHVCKRYYK